MKNGFTVFGLSSIRKILKDIGNYENNLGQKLHGHRVIVYFPLFVNVTRNKMRTFFIVLSEQNIFLVPNILF